MGLRDCAPQATGPRSLPALLAGADRRAVAGRVWLQRAAPRRQATNPRHAPADGPLVGADRQVVADRVWLRL